MIGNNGFQSSRGSRLRYLTDAFISYKARSAVSAIAVLVAVTPTQQLSGNFPHLVRFCGNRCEAKFPEFKKLVWHYEECHKEKSGAKT